VANRHFGKFADVWKHLPLAAVLDRERPDRYAETHAGSAAYPMIDDAERRFGAGHFTQAARTVSELARSPYLEVVSSFLEQPQPLYPGSATIAMSMLGANASYLFCDLDPASAADLRAWADRLVGGRAEVVPADGIASTARWLEAVDEGRTVVHIDPFDPHARSDGGMSALELAAYALERGHALVYWYGYDQPDDAGWAYDALRELTDRDLWCGDMMILDASGVGARGDLGAATTPGTGCGVVIGNVTADTTADCERLGLAVARIYHGVILPTGKPGAVQFTATSSHARSAPGSPNTEVGNSRDHKWGLPIRGVRSGVMAGSLAARVYERAHLEGEFRLRSGAISREYFDKYLFESDPAMLREIAETMVNLIPPDVDALAGLELGGIPIATALSQLTGISTLFVRKQAKNYGTCRLAEGGEITGRTLVVIEDVVTSAGQIVESVGHLRHLGATVSVAVCVIDRQAGGGANLADVSVELRSLFTINDLQNPAPG
jgi:orotate phosphoribosyltransferase